MLRKVENVPLLPPMYPPPNQPKSTKSKDSGPSVRNFILNTPKANSGDPKAATLPKIIKKKK